MIEFTNSNAVELPERWWEIASAPNDEEKSVLNSIATWESNSFPNGSSYRQQRLLAGHYDYDDGDGSEEICAIAIHYNGPIVVRWPDGRINSLHQQWQGVGAGVNLGAHFCSQDQMLTELA